MPSHRPRVDSCCEQSASRSPLAGLRESSQAVRPVQPACPRPRPGVERGLAGCGPRPLRICARPIAAGSHPLALALPRFHGSGFAVANHSCTKSTRICRVFPSLHSGHSGGRARVGAPYAHATTPHGHTGGGPGKGLPRASTPCATPSQRGLTRRRRRRPEPRSLELEVVRFDRSCVLRCNKSAGGGVEDRKHWERGSASTASNNGSRS